MSVETQSGVPYQFTAGDTVVFNVSNPSYPPATWGYDFVLSRDGQNLSTTRATNDDDGLSFDVTLTADKSGTLAPGRCKWFELFTEISTGQRVSGCSGYLTILPDPSQNLAKSEAQKRLENIGKILAGLKSNKSFSSGPQTFTKFDIPDLRKEEDRLKVQVLDELRSLGLSDRGGAKVIVNRFR